MNTLAAPPSVPLPASSTRRTATIAAVVLVPFVAFSLWVAAGHGALGFLTLAREEPWGAQMLLDLFVALSFAIGWMLGDARQRGITAWPFVAATMVLGSPGVLAYAVRRAFTLRPGT